MKTNTARRRRAGKTTTSMLSAMLLVAGSGCNCTTIYLTPPQQQGALQTPALARYSLSPPSGGNFAPATTLATGTTAAATVCNQPVTKRKATFYPPLQGPAPGENLFRGWIVNVSNNNQIIPNNGYVLQWFVAGSPPGCASPVSGSTTDVSFSVSNPKQYGMVAHFKTGHVPSTNDTIILNGVWTTQ